LDEAYAGDIVGIPNRGTLHLGDTLTEGEHLQFTGLPFFAPELFHEMDVKDPLRFKQLRTGLQHLGEEGAIQVFRPHHAGPLLLGAAGALQFEVVAHRLRHEYKAEVRMAPSKFKMARWITSDTSGEVDRFIAGNGNRVAYDVVDAPAVLIERPYELRTIAELWPKIKLHTLREHAGLVFHTH
jgi:peptide chain release factor 3